MYEVILSGVPGDKRPHLERVVHKHNRGLDHKACTHLVERVIQGGSEVVGRYIDSHAAENLLGEIQYHGATGEVTSDEPNEAE